MATGKKEGRKVRKEGGRKGGREGRWGVRNNEQCEGMDVQLHYSCVL